MSRLTDGVDDADPRVSADGKAVLFGGTYGGRRGLDLVNLHGGARTRLYDVPQEPQSPLHEVSRLILHDWSRDGRFALCDVTGFHKEIFAVKLSGGARQTVIQSPGMADQARFSPDARWIVYHDQEAGRLEVFVVPFPPTGERWQISTAGGIQPEWRADGRELFYVDASGTLMAVNIQTQPGFKADPPRPLFPTRLGRDLGTEEYRVTSDGQRFLLRIPSGGATRTTVLLNWQSLLKE